MSMTMYLYGRKERGDEWVAREVGDTIRTKDGVVRLLADKGPVDCFPGGAGVREYEVEAVTPHEQGV